MRESSPPAGLMDFLRAGAKPAAEAAANLLTNPVLDPFGKIPEFKYCAARLAGGGGEAEGRLAVE